MPIKICIWVSFVVAIVLDIIIWKYRKYASYIIYYELILSCLQAFLPLNYGDMSNLTYLFATVWVQIVYSCDMSRNSIATTLTLTFIQFCPHPIIHNEKINLVFVIGKLLNSLFLFQMCSIFSMLVTYIVQIRGKMSQLFLENLNLLNKMHEGIIVVSEKDQSL